jgi:positive regulator of sigma E activity
MLMTEVKRKDIKDSFILFFSQMLSFAIITINYRAIAQANYLWSILSDIIVAGLSYFVVRRIAKSKDSKLQWFGFTIGSAIGTCIGIFISLLLLGS